MSTAFIFSGQGSQSVGMLNQLSERLPEHCKQFFDSASESVEFDVWQLISEGPADKLNQTEYTQVAMLAADVWIFQLQREILPQINPSVMAGHSLGEYAALVCSGSISVEQGLKIVRRRGQLMQEAIPLGEGAMAAIIGLDNEMVSSICLDASDEAFNVAPANFNAPGQVVIAGHTIAVERAITLATDKQARMAKMIPVSVPCHCQLLSDAALQFKDYLSQFEFQLPSVPVIANINARPYAKVEDIKPWLIKQLYSPVLWVDSIEHMISDYAIASIVEVGPGNVLSGLVKRIDRSIKPQSAYVQLLSSLENNNGK